MTTTATKMKLIMMPMMKMKMATVMSMPPHARLTTMKPKMNMHNYPSTP